MKRQKAAKTKSGKAKSGKTKSFRAKSTRKRVTSASRARRGPMKKGHDDFVEALIDAGALALGLMIDPAWRDAVKFHLRLVLDHAALVEELPLPDDCEPAPVFHA